MLLGRFEIRPIAWLFSGFTGRQYRRIYSYSPSIGGTVPSQPKHPSNLSTATPFAPFCIDLLSDCCRALWITVRYHAIGERIENACLCCSWRQKRNDSRMIARLSDKIFGSAKPRLFRARPIWNTIAGSPIALDSSPFRPRR